ncbi:hypothetical protein ULO1_01280, partial [Carboxydocella sp. ULO1]
VVKGTGQEIEGKVYSINLFKLLSTITTCCIIAL